MPRAGNYSSARRRIRERYFQIMSHPEENPEGITHETRKDQKHRNDQNRRNEEDCTENDYEDDMLRAMADMRQKGGVQVREMSGYAPPEDSLDKLDALQRILHGMQRLDGAPCDGATPLDVSSLKLTSDTVASEAPTSDTVVSEAPTSDTVASEARTSGRKKWCKFGINCETQTLGCNFDHQGPWRRSQMGRLRETPCNNGAECTLKFCHFGHPPGHPLHKTSTLCAPCNTSNKANHSA